MGISSRPRSGRELFGNKQPQQHHKRTIYAAGGSSKKRSMKLQIAPSQSQGSIGGKAVIKRKRNTADNMSPEKEEGELKSPTRRRRQMKKKKKEEENGEEATIEKGIKVATAKTFPDSPPSPSSSDDADDDDTNDEEYSTYEEKCHKKQRQKLKKEARPSATPPP